MGWSGRVGNSSFSRAVSPQRAALEICQSVASRSASFQIRSSARTELSRQRAAGCGAPRACRTAAGHSLLRNVLKDPCDQDRESGIATSQGLERESKIHWDSKGLHTQCTRRKRWYLRLRDVRALLRRSPHHDHIEGGASKVSDKIGRIRKSVDFEMGRYEDAKGPLHHSDRAPVHSAFSTRPKPANSCRSSAGARGARRRRGPPPSRPEAARRPGSSSARRRGRTARRRPRRRGG